MRNLIPFLVLTRRANLKLLGEHESVLFGIAGFLEDKRINQTASPDQDYWRRLWEHWWQLRSQFEHLTLREPSRTTAG